MSERPIFCEKSIECVDCGVTFAFTVGEQEYFWSKGLSEPKRCPACRQLRRSTLPVRFPAREVQ